MCSTFVCIALSILSLSTGSDVEPNWSNAIKKSPAPAQKVDVPPITKDEKPLEPPPAPENKPAIESPADPNKIPGAPIAAVQVPPSEPIVIAIPTMRRYAHDGSLAPVTYLTDLVNGIEEGISPEQKHNVRYLLYNVDKEPEKHLEVQSLQAKLGGRLEVLVKASKGKTEEHPDEKVSLQYTDGHTREITRQTANWIAGETRDATNLLFDARKKAPYVMFLEDDVKPTANVVGKVYAYLAQLREAKKEDWFMIDLYTPKISWGRNPWHVVPLERYDYECCTQAMLFRSDRLLDLLLYETLHPNNPIDDNIRDFSREDFDNRGVYALVPNGFEHLGKFSSNPEKSSDTVEHQSINFVP